VRKDLCSAFLEVEVKKEEIEGVLLTPLRILQMRRAFVSEKRWMKIKKVYSAIGH
jgi:hypothetical protein